MYSDVGSHRAKYCRGVGCLLSTLALEKRKNWRHSAMRMKLTKIPASLRSPAAIERGHLLLRQ